MAESDGFLREIDEELRADKARQQLRVWGPWVLGAVLLIIAGVAAYSFWQVTEQNNREANGIALQNSLDFFRDGETAQGLNALEGDLKETMLAQFISAGHQESPEAAAAIYDKIAASVDAPETYRNLAVLLSVWSQYDSAEPALLRAKLAPILTPTSSWRYAGGELDMLLAARSGDNLGAQARYETLVNDAAAPIDVRERLKMYQRHFGFTDPEKQNDQNEAD